MNKYLLTEEQLKERDRQQRELCGKQAEYIIPRLMKPMNLSHAVFSIINADSPPLPEAIQPQSEDELDETEDWDAVLVDVPFQIHPATENYLKNKFIIKSK